MPHLKITTSVSKSSIPNNFLKETSALISKMLGKPESVSTFLHHSSEREINFILIDLNT